MAMFLLGILFGWVIEWLLYTFWWQPRQARREADRVAEARRACEAELGQLKERLQDKDRELSHLAARVAHLQQAAEQAEAAGTESAAQTEAGAAAEAETAAQAESEAEPDTVAEAASEAAAAPEPEAAAEPEAEPEADDAAEAPSAASDSASEAAQAEDRPSGPESAGQPAPEPAAAPDRPADPRSLQAVSGIGPKIASVLAAAGIDSLERLAETPVDELRRTLEAAGSRFALASVESWPEQARLLAAGDEEGLQRLLAERRR